MLHSIPFILNIFSITRILYAGLTSLALTLVCFPFSSLAQTPSAQPQLNLPRIELVAGMYRIEVQIASTTRQLQTGLMFRQEMPQNEGMLFVFPEAQVQCFWMKNTILPLSAAFIGDDGSIINIANMQPQSLESHCSLEPVRFVLEMHQGWFEQHGFNAGSRIQGEPFQREP